MSTLVKYYDRTLNETRGVLGAGGAINMRPVYPGVYLSKYYTLLCDEVDDCFGDANNDETDPVAAEIYQIQLPADCLGITATLEQNPTIAMYNNGTNSYAVFPRTRGALLTVGTEDVSAAIDRMKQTDNAPGGVVDEAETPSDTIYVPPNGTIQSRWNAGDIDTVHAAFLRGDAMRSNIGGAGGTGQVVIGGTPVINYLLGRLHITAYYEG